MSPANSASAVKTSWPSPPTAPRNSSLPACKSPSKNPSANPALTVAQGLQASIFVALRRRAHLPRRDASNGLSPRNSPHCHSSTLSLLLFSLRFLLHKLHNPLLRP